MPTTPAFRRLHRRGGIDRFAGLPPRFTRDGDSWLFRRHGHGPALRVGDDEYAAFMRAGLRAIILHVAALPLFLLLAWLVMERLLPEWSSNALAALFGVVLSLIVLALFGSLRHRADAPARALAGRVPVAPARDPDGSAQPGWSTIVGITLLMLFMAAIGTRQPAGSYIAFASASVMLGLILAIRRWRFDAALTPVQRERLRERRAAEHAIEIGRIRRQPGGHWWQLPLFLGFLALELAFIAGGVLLGVGVAVAATGRSAEELSFGLFMLGFLPGLALGILLFQPLERLCKRWTGSSAMHAFDWLPASW